MSRYSNQYEAGLDPFAVFSAKVNVCIRNLLENESFVFCVMVWFSNAHIWY